MFGGCCCFQTQLARFHTALTHVCAGAAAVTPARHLHDFNNTSSALSPPWFTYSLPTSQWSFRVTAEFMILVSMHSINMHIQNSEDYKLTVPGVGDRKGSQTFTASWSTFIRLFYYETPGTPWALVFWDYKMAPFAAGKDIKPDFCFSLRLSEQRFILA